MAAAKKPASSSSAPAEEQVESQIEKTAERVWAPVAEVQQHLRQGVEKSVADTRAAYAKAKSAVEEATDALESSYATAAKGIVEFNAKTLEALRANAEANLDFIKAVISVKSVAEFVALQNEHIRKQAEAISAQAKEIAFLAQKVAAEAVEPIKSQVAKTLKSIPGGEAA